MKVRKVKMTFLFSIFLVNKIEIIKEMLNSLAFVQEEDFELSFLRKEPNL